ncbi:IS110 family transposase [Flavobacterium sp. NG2]|uniref:IS110 family transposase n=1 Tax=Flavobacterium sp. NG2 TaxID=3097547 RepID=UPI002A80190E|nr:IS110 family transposase [Flavobacterium sp. NG2]WPR71904.1 IS110 family transposase [Flavobacterium sp. NG2]WPR71910.1 IS110 family transposase [Flavobacterium sp. NG2]WPR72175.1 IS110 family transposase [Flavobacterium sp. NG2]WPR72783.1 IS110 family transposase [Flavobacterium sp. NG2]
MILKYSVGLDVSSSKIDGSICVIDENQQVQFKSKITFNNTVSGFESLDSWITKWHKEMDLPLVVCMEATGVYHENCALYLFEKGYKLSIVLPNKAKKYLECLGLKSKNDSIDARGLAQMGAEQCLSLWEPLGRYYYELRHYTRQHQNIQELKTVISNQIHALEHSMYRSDLLIDQLKSTITLFDAQLKELDKKMKLHLKSDAVVYNKCLNILAIKGIGYLTIATLIAETNGFELFKNYKQLVSYAGYDVVEAQSGTRVGKTKISKKGNSRIRRALHMPSLIVITCKEKPFLDLYNRTFEKHAIKMKSYVAVQKKLLVMVYHLWKKNKRYDTNYRINIQEKEQELSSLLAFEKGTNAKMDKKISPKQVEAKQGKHSTKNRSMLPLC